jgi:hypothetical protein
MSVSGYTRVSSGVILTGHTINASDSNNEYNALQTAFDVTVGHNHDGTVGGGQAISVASLSGLNSGSSGLVKASGSNTFTAATLATADIANSSVTYAKIQNETNNTFLGNSSGGAAAPSEQTIGATLTFVTSQLRTVAMTGDVTSAANSFVTTIAKIAGTSITGTTGSGNVMLSTSPTFSSNAATITGGSIDATAIGNATPASGKFTTLNASGATVINTFSSSNATITGGSIDSTVIGGITPTDAFFNNTTVNNNLIAANATISGGAINGTTIGFTTPAYGGFTTMDAGVGLANFVEITGAVTTNAPQINFQGSDANVSGIINTKGNSSNLNLRVNGATSLSISGGSTIINSVNVAGGASGVNPAISFQGAAGVGGLIYTASTGNIDIKHDNTSSFCTRFLRVSGATNAITLAGSATSPTISTTAGDLTLNSTSGNVLSNTPTALDNSTKVATTAFVKTSGVSLSTLTTKGITGSLSTTDLGSVIDITAASITLTLPAVASCPTGSAIMFVTDAGLTSGTWTLKGNAAENIVRGGAAGTNSVTVSLPTSIIAISTNSKWIVYG